MTCIICYGDDMQVATVREELHMGPDVVYVPHPNPCVPDLWRKIL